MKKCSYCDRENEDTARRCYHCGYRFATDVLSPAGASKEEEFRSGRPPIILIGGVEKRRIVIADYDPIWPQRFKNHAAIIARAMGPKALHVEHVGSTSVPGLAAKPIIDIVVVVEDSANEDAYLPLLLAAGYVLRVREPGWHQHRMLRTPELDVHVHVFSSGCSEIARMLAFRDCLRGNFDDRCRYETLKRDLAKRDWPDMNGYAKAKSELVEAIITQAIKQPND